MKTTFYIIVAVVIFILMSNITITINPFTIKFKSLDLAFAWVFLFVGFMLMQHHYYEKGQKYVIDTIEKELNDKKSK
jgi:hypothetical protein